VGLTNVVLSAVPDNLASAPARKPVIAIRNACPPASIGSGATPVIAGGVVAQAPAMSAPYIQRMRKVMDSALRYLVPRIRWNSQL
jgi:hypothetical protein